MSKTNKAVLFDFDGLILDTETPEVLTWQEIFAQVGLDFDLEAYLQIVGSFASQAYQPRELLRAHLGDEQRLATLLEHYRANTRALIDAQPVLPGAPQVIVSAKRMGLLVAIGSSSPRAWVHGHLQRLGLFKEFDTIVTFDDVAQPKPSPEIFQLALSRLGVHPANALVLEDSHNGILAAQRAGIRAVAVPNFVTKSQDFSLAQEALPSLEALDLAKYFPG